MLAPILALGIPTTLGVAAFTYFKVTLDGPRALIVVVDRRTATLAHRRIATAIKDGDLARAHAGLTALILWLKQEIRTGPKRHRVGYARKLEQAELRKEQVSEEMGLPAPTV